MKFSTQLLLPVMAVAAACGGAGAGDTSTASVDTGATNQAPVMPSNAQVAALVYDNSYSVPAGFFVDERAGTERSYTVHHVLDESSSYELCTDDYGVAMAWEEADNASRSVRGYYVESYDNVRYFEFVRELSYDDDVGNIDDITSPGFARVFKCSNTNRNGVDRSLLSGYAGTLHAQPLDADSIRVFAEYLWQFTFFPNSRKKVIGSYSTQTSDTLQHTLQLAFSRNQGSGNCDLIEVAEWRFGASRADGRVSKDFEVIASFPARLEAGIPVLCD